MSLLTLILMMQIESGSGVRSVNVARLEQRIVDRINDEREKHQWSRLKLETRLAGIARAHSRNMADHGFMSHVSPDGKGPSQRASAAGYSSRKQAGIQTYTGIAISADDKVLIRQDFC